MVKKSRNIEIRRRRVNVASTALNLYIPVLKIQSRLAMAYSTRIGLSGSFTIFLKWMPKGRMVILTTLRKIF